MYTHSRRTKSLRHFPSPSTAAPFQYSAANYTYPFCLSPTTVPYLPLIFRMVARSNGMQHFRHDSSLLSQSNLILEEMSRTTPYSLEEKKVRIERYRINRNQRKFGKKVKYSCRKTLADNRARIGGRFAKNGEIAPVEWSQMGVIREEENWPTFFDSLVPPNQMYRDSVQAAGNDVPSISLLDFSSVKEE
ncbi:hypothetical protein VNO78_05592 [Psophocarpus tetragonolobus]|uniref:CCT domain-containing protein n=1 Tax=Psophocarpus tetragonolobus TaxID=3891 RepID=A0AAN9T0Z3_PSOTE